MPLMKYESGASRASRALLDGCEECELFARQCAVPFTSYELSATVMSKSLSRGCIVICSGPSEAPSAVSSPRARSLGTVTISRDLPEESLVCVKTKHPPPPVPAIAPPLSSRIPQRAPFPWANDRPAAIESPRTRRPSHDNAAADAASHLSRYSPRPPLAQMMTKPETKTARAHTRVREHRHDGWGVGCHTRREIDR